MTKEALHKRLEGIEKRLEILEGIVLKGGGMPLSPDSPLTSLDVRNLLNLPDSLRKTMIAIQDLKEATAEEVAKKSGRTRSVETIYLNELTRLGHLTRLRKGRKIFFKLLRYY